MDGKETVGVEMYGTLFKWLYVDIGSSRLNIHADVRERERGKVLERCVSRATGNNMMTEFTYAGIPARGERSLSVPQLQNVTRWLTIVSCLEVELN
jgi:hypothetical protein